VLAKKAAKEAAPPDDKAKRTRTYLEPGTLPGGEPVKIDAHSPWKLRGGLSCIARTASSRNPEATPV
jgi:hypothetical protein